MCPSAHVQPQTLTSLLAAVRTQLPGFVRSAHVRPACKGHNEHSRVVIAAELLGVRQDCFRGGAWIGCATREVDDLVVGHDRGNTVGEKDEKGPLYAVEERSVYFGFSSYTEGLEAQVAEAIERVSVSVP